MVEDIVVRVNDQIITRSDVERQQQQLIQAAAQNQGSPAQIAEEQKNMLRDMIDQQLLLSRAKELGLNADNDVIRQLDDIRKKNGMATMEELEQAARKEGINFEDFKAQIRNQLLTQMVVRDEVGRRLQITQADEKKYYEEHKQEFLQPEQIRLSEILIPTPDNATEAQIAQAKATAQDVKAQLDKGADFADLAKKYSGGPSAAQGGELGEFKRGALAKGARRRNLLAARRRRCPTHPDQAGLGDPQGHAARSGRPRAHEGCRDPDRKRDVHAADGTGSAPLPHQAA